MEEKLSKPSYLEGNSKTEGQPVSNEKPETRQIVQGKVTVRKQPAGKRLRESLGLEETRTVGDYLVWDVLLPAMKETIAEVVKKGIDVFLYGGSQESRSRNRRSSGKSYVSYEGYYGKRHNDRERMPSDRYERNRSDFREFVFERRQDAEDVLSELCEIIDTYGIAKVSDFYTMVGESERNFTDHSYGWEALGNATVERVRDGWIVNLPKPISLR